MHMKFKMTPTPYDPLVPVRYTVGTCLQKGDHYYLQRSDNVLHVNVDGCINTLFVNALDAGLQEITSEEFDRAVKGAIYDMELEKYWTLKK